MNDEMNVDGLKLTIETRTAAIKRAQKRVQHIVDGKNDFRDIPINIRSLEREITLLVKHRLKELFPDINFTYGYSSGDWWVCTHIDSFDAEKWKPIVYFVGMDGYHCTNEGKWFKIVLTTEADASIKKEFVFEPKYTDFHAEKLKMFLQILSYEIEAACTFRHLEIADLAHIGRSWLFEIKS